MKTVTRPCSTEFLNSLTSSGQPYDVLVGVVDIENGDVVVYEDPEGKQTGRYISNVNYGHKLELGIAEGSDQDFTILGLNADPASLLESLFHAGSALIGLGLEVHDKAPYLVGEPQYLPILAVEPIDPKVLLDAVKVTTWPDGCFSLLFMAKAMDVSTGRPVLEIIDYTVMAMTRLDGQDVFVEVDERLLKAGKIRDKFGRFLEPYFGDINAGQADEELDQAAMDEVMQIVKGDE